MLSLLNAVDFFEKTLENWDAKVAKVTLITTLVILSVVATVLFVYMVMLLRRNKSTTDEHTEVQPAASNTAEVRNDEVIEQQALDDDEDDDFYEQEVEEEPATANDFDDFQPAVRTAPYAETVEEESVKAGRLGYSKSFTAHLIQAEDQVKSWYTVVKNEILSHKKVSCRTSWRCETFRCHGEPVARFIFRGKTLCLTLPLNAADFVEEYGVEDVADVAKYADTPLLLRIKNNKRFKNAISLIGTVMEQNDIQRLAQYQSVDYYVPYEGTVELIEKGLIKRRVVNRK